MTIKIFCIQSKDEHFVEVSKPGENQMTCPECSSTRRKSKDKCLSWNNTKKTGHCHHCNADFVERDEEPIVYKLPSWSNETKLTDKAVKYLESRGISQAVMKQMSLNSSTKFFPQTGKEMSCIQFPFFRNGQVVNIKSRSGTKDFTLEKDCEKILYNEDAIRNHPSKIVIVEGEIDCLSIITAGITGVVSVPNGAGRNLRYLDSIIDDLEKVDSFIIAVDNDLRGIELRLELIRRLGSEKCFIVLWGDYKDANEALMSKGASYLVKCINEAIPVPLDNVKTVGMHEDEILNVYHNGIGEGLKLGVNEIDKNVRWETKRVAVVTGLPSHGKSEFVDYVASLLNIVHSWKIAYYSPENYPIANHINKLLPRFSGRPMSKDEMSLSELQANIDYLDKNVFFIDEELTLIDDILKSAKSLVRRKGIKVLVIDHFACLDTEGQSETNYIKPLMTKLTMFARSQDVLIFIVAHPTKTHNDDDGFPVMPKLYNVAGSANWRNKTDYGFTVYRNMKGQEYENCADIEKFRYTNKVNVFWEKIKFDYLGEMQTFSKLQFHKGSGRYAGIDDNFDTNSWVTGMSYDWRGKEVEPKKSVDPMMNRSQDYDEVYF